MNDETMEDYIKALLENMADIKRELHRIAIALEDE